MLETRRRGKNGDAYCIECKRVTNNRWYQASHPKKSPQKLKRPYGLAKDQAQAIVAKQGGLCALCLRSPKGRRLHVDHDHLSGRVRGLLCHHCNTALGLLGEDPNRMRAAAMYVESNES